MSAVPRSIVSPFRYFWNRGYRALLPIVPPGAPLSEKSNLYKRAQAGKDTRGKVPGVRWTDGTWSGMDWIRHQTTEADLDRWTAMGAGVGLRCGGPQRVVGIDVDTLNPDHAKIISDTIIRRLGKLPVRVGQWPKALYVCRIRGDEPLSYMRVEFAGERMELLGEGRQFAGVVGDHPKTGKPYEWVRELVPYDDLPEFPLSMIVALFEELCGLLPEASKLIREGGHSGPVPDQDSLRGDLELVRRAVELIPNTNDRFLTRESYVAFGIAVKAALPDHPREAFEIWSEWAWRWEDLADDESSTPAILEKEWGGMKPPYKIGASYLYWLAAAYAPEEFSGGEAWFEPPEAGGEGGHFPDFFQKPLEKPSVLRLTPFDEAADSALSAAAPLLIKGLLDQGAMSVLYGESNAGKTFVALDMAHAIACGRPWGGMKTARLPVVYVAAEGGRGARKRAAALRAKYGPVDGFSFVLSPVNLLRPDADIGPLILAVKAAGAGFVGLDTLSRAMAGGDENTSTDMGALVKHMDALRAVCGCHVMGVHHSGKDRAKGARGHSLLRAATDTEIEVADGQIVVTKQRDLDGSWSSAFALDVVNLGESADGDLVTSCTVRLLGKAEAKPEGVLSGPEADVFAVMQTLRAMQENGEAGDHLIATADIVSAMAELGMSKSAVTMRLTRLLQKNKIKRAKRGKLLILAKNNERQQEATESVASVFD